MLVVVVVVVVVAAAAAAAAVAAATLSGAVKHAAVEPDAVAATFVELQLGLGLVHDAVQRVDCWPLSILGQLRAISRHCFQVTVVCSN